MEKELEKIKEIGITALKKATETHDKLGFSGEEIVHKNQFGDTAVKADIEIEKTIISFLKELNFPIRIISEEHGTVDIVKNPKMLGILDGVDGSGNYKNGRGKKRYGTMFGIFSNINPKYGDYLFSGIIEHSRKRLFYAVKNNGGFLVEKDKEQKTSCSKVKRLDKNTKIYVDSPDYWEFNRKTFSEKLKDFDLDDLKSSSMHHADLASGEVDLVLECTRKNNLEIAISFGLINESGGEIMKIDGKSIRDELYLKFGQDKHLPIILSCTKELGLDLIRKINL